MEAADIYGAIAQSYDAAEAFGVYNSAAVRLKQAQMNAKAGRIDTADRLCSTVIELCKKQLPDQRYLKIQRSAQDLQRKK